MYHDILMFQLVHPYGQIDKEVNNVYKTIIVLFSFLSILLSYRYFPFCVLPITYLILMNILYVLAMANLEGRLK